MRTMSACCLTVYAKSPGLAMGSVLSLPSICSTAGLRLREDLNPGDVPFRTQHVEHVGFEKRQVRSEGSAPLLFRTVECAARHEGRLRSPRSARISIQHFSWVLLPPVLCPRVC